MSQLVTQPYFECGCPATPRPPTPPPQNPDVYYNKALGTPTQQGLVPFNAGLPAQALEINGSGPGYIWNPQTATWN